MAVPASDIVGGGALASVGSVTAETGGVFYSHGTSDMLNYDIRVAFERCAIDHNTVTEAGGVVEFGTVSASTPIISTSSSSS